MGQDSVNETTTENTAKFRQQGSRRRVRTPTVLQMEAVECGAAALGIVLGYFGRIVPLEELRCLRRLARRQQGRATCSRPPATTAWTRRDCVRRRQTVRPRALPVIVFWNFNHFLVRRGLPQGRVYLNDPAIGPRR